jgi:uncharacterized repeat protein (TIGR03803 family)
MKYPCCLAKSYFIIGAFVLLGFAIPSHAYGAKDRVFDFTGGADGSSPMWSGNLIADSKSNLYGTTLQGGKNNGGTVFELSMSAAGPKKTILYNFPGSVFDASDPGSSLVFLKRVHLISADSITPRTNVPSSVSLSFCSLHNHGQSRAVVRGS